MELTLERKLSNETCTYGELFVNGNFECFTLEDVVRKEKIKGSTAIPEGQYEVLITRSNRFGRDLPLLLNVPNFTGVRIHSGNSSADTEGCILVGMEITHEEKDWISKSKQAFESLFAKICEARNRKEKVTIRIRNA